MFEEMNSQEFREFGKAAIDLIADYRDTIRNRDVIPSVEPGQLIDMLPAEAPEQPESWKDVLHDFQETILPFVTHWRSPRFNGYFPAGASYPSVVGQLLSDGLGVIGVNWKASPACTELEVVTMNWLGKLMGLPEEFLNCSSGPGGGVIQGAASTSTLIALLVAKERTVRNLMENKPSLDENQIRANLVAYTSNQSNSSVEKAFRHASVKMRIINTDDDGALIAEDLKNAFEQDRAEGLIPCYVVANLGTTEICAFDRLYEIGPICKEHDAWLHVDAAYAGAAFVCPEYRHLMKGIEYADSFVFNPHKWLLVNFDCAAMWLKNSFDLIQAFDIQRTYLNDAKIFSTVPSYRHWQIPLGRGFRALKLWTVLRTYGGEGLRNHIRNQISLAQHFEKLVRSDDRFIVEPKPAMSLVCFRLQEGDSSTKKLLENLTEKKEVFMVGAYYKSRFVIRYAVGCEETVRKDVEYSWARIKEEADEVCSEIHLKDNVSSNIHIDTLDLVEIQNYMLCSDCSVTYI